MQLRRPKQFLISPYQTVFTLCLFCVHFVFYKKKPSYLDKKRVQTHTFFLQAFLINSKYIPGKDLIDLAFRETTFM